MLLFDAPLTFREFMTHEDLPLATIFHAVATFLQHRKDVALFGAHAVNAYCRPERMTQDVDVLATRAAGFAEELRAHLTAQFHVAIRVREIVPGVGFRVYQLRKPRNRHLVDVRQMDTLPSCETLEGVAVVAPLELVVMKTMSLSVRGGQEKGLSDRLDLIRLLRAFPALKAPEGPVAARLSALGATSGVLATWRDVAATELAPSDDGDDDEDGDER